MSLGNSSVYQTVQATRSGSNWTANIAVLANTTTSDQAYSCKWHGANPYAWIDTGRYFTPATGSKSFYTTEGVFGICARGPTTFADPPDRNGLMAAMFGNAIINAGVFAAREMPHGATLFLTATFTLWFMPRTAFAPHLFWLMKTLPAGRPGLKSR